MVGGAGELSGWGASSGAGRWRGRRGRGDDDDFAGGPGDAKRSPHRLSAACGSRAIRPSHPTTCTICRQPFLKHACSSRRRVARHRGRGQRARRAALRPPTHPLVGFGRKAPPPCPARSRTEGREKPEPPTKSQKAKAWGRPTRRPVTPLARFTIRPPPFRRLPRSSGDLWGDTGCRSEGEAAGGMKQVWRELVHRGDGQDRPLGRREGGVLAGKRGDGAIGLVLREEGGTDGEMGERGSGRSDPVTSPPGRRTAGGRTEPPARNPKAPAKGIDSPAASVQPVPALPSCKRPAMQPTCKPFNPKLGKSCAAIYSEREARQALDLCGARAQGIREAGLGIGGFLGARQPEARVFELAAPPPSRPPRPALPTQSQAQAHNPSQTPAIHPSPARLAPTHHLLIAYIPRSPRTDDMSELELNRECWP